MGSGRPGSRAGQFGFINQIRVRLMRTTTEIITLFDKVTFRSELIHDRPPGRHHRPEKNSPSTARSDGHQHLPCPPNDSFTSKEPLGNFSSSSSPHPHLLLLIKAHERAVIQSAPRNSDFSNTRRIIRRHEQVEQRKKTVRQFSKKLSESRVSVDGSPKQHVFQTPLGNGAESSGEMEPWTG